MRTGQVTRWIIGAALAVGVVLVLISYSSTTRGSEREVSVVVPDATNVLGGQYVKDAGVNVGTVHSIQAVNGGRDVKLVFYLDRRVWPLTQGTTMTLRWGGTVSFVNRYINLVRGPASAPPMATNGVLPAADFRVPVEFDSFLDTFTPPVRANLKDFLDNAGISLADAKPGLIRAIEHAPPALSQVDAVLNDLDANEPALSSLVANGSQVVGAVNASTPGVQSLIANAAATFSALNTRTRQIASTLQTAPGLLSQTQRTLATATPVLHQAQTVAAKLAGGITQVNEDARPLDGVLVTLQGVTPDAVSALASLHRATPSLNPLLSDLTSLSPTVASIGSQANTSLDCIRPYTPDAAAFASDWGDFLSATFGKDHYFRAMVQEELGAADTAENYDSAQLKKNDPWIAYAYPPPPGYAAGQPWFLPQCNEGPSSLNPDDDPEANTSVSELPAPTPNAAARR